MKQLLTLALLASSVLFFASGCGDSGGPDPKVEEVRLNAAKEMRTLFDKAGGEYSRLDANDKAAFDKLAGGADKAAQVWGSMKYGPLGAPSGTDGERG